MYCFVFSKTTKTVYTVHARRRPGLVHIPAEGRNFFGIWYTVHLAEGLCTNYQVGTWYVYMVQTKTRVGTHSGRRPLNQLPTTRYMVHGTWYRRRPELVHIPAEDLCTNYQLCTRYSTWYRRRLELVHIPAEDLCTNYQVCTRYMVQTKTGVGTHSGRRPLYQLPSGYMVHGTWYRRRPELVHNLAEDLCTNYLVGTWYSRIPELQQTKTGVGTHSGRRSLYQLLSG